MSVDVGLLRSSMGDWSHGEAHRQDDVLQYLTKSQTLAVPATRSIHECHNGDVNRSLDDIFPPSPPAPKERLTNGGVAVFCTRATLDKCVAFLNQELSVLGFSSLYHAKSDTFDVVPLVNAAQELLQIHRDHLKHRGDLEHRNHRTVSDLDRAHGTIQRLREDMEQAQREAALVLERERQAVIKNKTLLGKLKHANDEVKKLQSIVQHRDGQYRHDLRKRERETSRLKERLHQLLTDKSQDKRIGMDIVNALPRADGARRATWKTHSSGSRHEEELYKLVIANFEQSSKELMEENRALWEQLADVESRITALAQSPAAEDDEVRSIETASVSSLGSCSHGNGPAAEEEQLFPGQFHMPYDAVKEDLQQRLQHKFELLRERFSQAGALDTAVHPNKQVMGEIEALKAKCERYKEVVEKQELLLQQAILNHVDQMDGQLFLNGENFLGEKELLNEEKTLFYEQKSNFEKERRIFTDGAIRLGRERKQFEEERAAYFKEQFLMIPSPGGTHDGSNLTPTKPLVEAAPPNGGCVTTPSTDQLYRALRLRPHSVAGEKLTHTQSSPTLSQPVSALSEGTQETRCDSRGQSKIVQRICAHTEHIREAVRRRSTDDGLTPGNFNSL